MASKTLYFQGKSKWTHLTAPDTRFGNSNWSIMVYLTPESYNKFLELTKMNGEVTGILNKIKLDEDGHNVTFKRPTSKLIKGKVQGFAPPEVTAADGKTPFRELIGHGSDVTVGVEYYLYPKPTGGKGSAIRLKSVKIDNHVPYNPDTDRSDEQIALTAGLEEQKPAF